MDLSVLKKILEDLDVINKNINAFIDKHQDKHEWGSDLFNYILKSNGKKACGNDKTALFHINKTNKFSSWKDWVNDVFETNKEYYAQRLRLMSMSYKHLKDIKDEDINFITEELERMKKEKRTKDFKITDNNTITSNKECANIIEKRLEEILSGKIKPTKFDLFGILLPPRRAEVANIKCLKDTNEVNKDDDGKLNYYIKNNRTFIFEQYKTAGKYGTQFFSLNELNEILPFLDKRVKDIVINLVDKELFKHDYNLIRQEYNNGKKYNEGCYSGVYSTNNGFSINDCRKYWSSKIFKTGNIEHYKKLNCWLSHSAGVDVNHYQKV